MCVWGGGGGGGGGSHFVTKKNFYIIFPETDDHNSEQFSKYGH